MFERGTDLLDTWLTDGKSAKVGKIYLPGCLMTKRLSLFNLIHTLQNSLDGLPEHRKGKNTTYLIRDAALGAFSVFFMQSSSFLAHQENMQRNEGRNNASSLFGLKTLPSDNQIRNLLDPLEPEHLFPVFAQVSTLLEESGELQAYRSYRDNLLIILDGTQYFSSQEIHCDNCSHRTHGDEAIYFHAVITPVIAAPGNSRVIALEPEFIVPQDGHEKQDCERAAAKRWLEQYGPRYATLKATLLGDDLFCNQPLCENVLEKKLNFIFVCKPDSHPELYQMVEFLDANGQVEQFSERSWKGKYAEIYTYRYVNQVPLRAGADALKVNWCELTIQHETTGKITYRNAWATHHEITRTTVKAIVQAGRTRWKVENENNNVLKTKGYHFEHNFGHGTQHLATFLLTLNLLAFLFHTVLDLADAKYKLLRTELRARKTFFDDLRPDPLSVL
jgi:hypothetical protein